MIYLVYHINESLGIAPSETPDNVDRLHIGYNRLNHGWEFILGDSAADQVSQGSSIGVGNGGSFREVVRIP